MQKIEAFNQALAKEDYSVRHKLASYMDAFLQGKEGYPKPPYKGIPANDLKKAANGILNQDSWFDVMESAIHDLKEDHPEISYHDIREAAEELDFYSAQNRKNPKAYFDELFQNLQEERLDNAAPVLLQDFAKKMLCDDINEILPHFGEDCTIEDDFPLTDYRKDNGRLGYGIFSEAAPDSAHYVGIGIIDTVLSDENFQENFRYDLSRFEDASELPFSVKEEACLIDSIVQGMSPSYFVNTATGQINDTSVPLADLELPEGEPLSDAFAQMAPIELAHGLASGRTHFFRRDFLELKDYLSDSAYESFQSELAYIQKYLDPSLSYQKEGDVITGVMPVYSKDKNASIKALLDVQAAAAQKKSADRPLRNAIETTHKVPELFLTKEEAQAYLKEYQALPQALDAPYPLAYHQTFSKPLAEQLFQLRPYLPSETGMPLGKDHAFWETDDLADTIQYQMEEEIHKKMKERQQEAFPTLADKKIPEGKRVHLLKETLDYLRLFPKDRAAVIQALSGKNMQKAFKRLLPAATQNESLMKEGNALLQAAQHYKPAQH